MVGSGIEFCYISQLFPIFTNRPDRIGRSVADDLKIIPTIY